MPDQEVPGMIAYLIAVLGLAVLCSLWVLFQLWIKKHAPEVRPLNLCCGSCDSSECHREKGTEQHG
jgi:hypothetical protein